MSEATDELSGRRDSTYIRALLIVIAAVVIVLVTHQLLPAAVASFLLVAVPLWRTGWRLFAMDGDRSRALTLLMFYVAAGGFAGAIHSFVVILSVTFLGRHQQGAGVPEMFVPAFLAMLAGLGICCLAGLTGIVRAIMTSQRVWVHPAAFRHLEQVLTGQGHSVRWEHEQNRVAWIAGVSLGVPAILLSGVIVRIFATAPEAGREPSAVVTAALLSMPVLGIGAVILTGRVLKRIKAQHPFECWVPEITAHEKSAMPYGIADDSESNDHDN